MKKIKYKVSDGEIIGLVPFGSIIDCYLVHESCEIDGGLVYMPKKINFVFDGEKGYDSGCGSLSFAILEDRKCKHYVRYGKDYINLDPKESNSFEKRIKKI